ncbi:hypothetical protein UWK_02720 [Desulfocapsa sulfexigens DSM 10523]|uniref:PRTase-CE domain-containing protein n=1 Tax=Desulfocapsa sulfexigens (strain DSM 10523 / SB164P1) TaxID=1167006 RepID=M1PSC5_DESSD|nr:hypothetical protein [Desulfocapsa sulfexigens]AGF79256.1 hypothetical protein UWK_02720 [Desulfocapsa sulfexigens DSM 10523]
MAEITKYFPRLNKIFIQKNWFKKFEEAGFEDILTNFIKIIEGLSDDEADLLLKLTEDYLYVDANAMQRCFREIYCDISIELIAGFEEVYFLPLIAPDDSQNTKSQSSVLYPAYHQLNLMCRQNGLTNNLKIESKDLMTALGNSLADRGDCLLIFVDDFIGTGRSALKALSAYESNFRKSTDVVAVMCAVCQSEGKEKLKNAGFDVWANHIRKKGLTDSQKITEIGKAIEIMKGISARIISNSKHYLGFASSEALVTMPFRTPNNTFPVYWADNGSGTAPFYR